MKEAIHQPEEPTEHSLKDPALVWQGGWFYLYCSAFYGPNWSKIMGFRSKDLARFERLPIDWGSGSDGWCSPDIVKVGQEWVMTLQSWDGAPVRESWNQVFYKTSSDLQNWSAPHPLAADLTAGKRAIDAAVAKNGASWYAVYKEAQTPRLATASNLSGPWTQLPDPFSCWAENYQFMKIGGAWHVIATLLDHRQGMAKMVGTGDRPEDWSSWAEFTLFDTPIRQGLNSSMVANASCLLDHRENSGWWYRAFCCSDQPPRGNLGYSLGLARSKDLKDWELMEFDLQ